MERSSKFLSLSGLSGIAMGLIALAGAGAAYYQYQTAWTPQNGTAYWNLHPNHRQEMMLVFPATLIFYGLALVNAGKHTWKEVTYLGITEIALGCAAMFVNDYAYLFLCWIIGFGFLHIFYGALMHFRHEKGILNERMREYGNKPIREGNTVTHRWGAS